MWKSRYAIAASLQALASAHQTHSDSPVYWMDFGNRQHTGQVALSTVGTVRQPTSKKFRPVSELPLLTEEFKPLLEQADRDDTPSCSLAEALTKQDLFINSTLAQMGTSLLWQMFRDGMVTERGFFLNLKNFRSQPLSIG